MQSQHRIHEIPPVLWPRCSKVDLKDGQFCCHLALDRQYDLIAAYPKGPHIQFLNCKSIESLLSFTRAWGPLYLVRTPGGGGIKVGTAVRRLDELQAHQRWLCAVKGMIDACRGRADERKSLLEFLAAEADLDRTSNTYRSGSTPMFHKILQLTFSYETDSITWAASTDVGSVKKALAFSVETCVHVPTGYLKVEQRQKTFEITPTFSVVDLWEALRWMLWFDEWNRKPLRSCSECNRIFDPRVPMK